PQILVGMVQSTPHGDASLRSESQAQRLLHRRQSPNPLSIKFCEVAMQIALVLYPKFTVLDIIGPFQALVDVPGHDVVFVGAEPGPVLDHTGRCPLVASASFAAVPSPDVVVVPGGNSKDFAGPVASWLRSVYPSATWVTSVCTGSIFLAAAGLLDGVDATTHWAWTEHLEKYGARYTQERVVERGKIITSAGVSSGIDMALALLGHIDGPEVAQAVQLAIEYDPQSPFDAGSPSKAPDEIVELVRAVLQEVIDAA
ncbi:MAG: DJ-1/PfpI family protein, partial [Ilumatobacteraceae bacterium]